MIAMLLSFVMAMAPLAGAQGSVLPFEIRADKNLIMGKGEQSGETYYDAVISKDAAKGILVKLPYTQKGGRFSFDLHHRISLTPNYADAEVTTIIEVITGGGTSVGVYTLIDKISSSSRFDESIAKVSTAEVDRYVTPLSRKSVIVETRPGPQTVS